MKSEEYWKKRSEEILENALKNGDEVVKKLKKEYAKAELDIKKDINALMGVYMLQTGLGYNAAKKLLDKKELYEWRMEIGEYLSAIENASSDAQRTALALELNTLAMQSRIGRLEALNGRIKGRMAELAVYEDNLVGDLLKETVEDTYYNNMFEFHKNGVITDDLIEKIADDDIKDLLKLPFKGKNYSQRIWKREWKVADKVEELVTSSISTGRSIERLEKDFQKSIAEVATEPLRKSFKTDVERLIRTEVAYAKSVADLEFYKEMGIEEYKFSATLDVKTSDTCQQHDNKVFEVDKAVIGDNFPPLHPRCRSTTVAVNPYYNPKTRAARGVDGKTHKVPADMSYEEWYAEYVEKDPEYLAKAKSHKNKYSDKKQYERYKDVLGEKAPKSFEKFQKLKYNDSENFERLKDKYYINNKFKKGIWKNKVNAEKQAKHMKSTASKGKSYFEDDVDVNALYEKYSGTGRIDIVKNRRTHRELIDFKDGEVKGFDALSNKNINGMTIHYSKTGAHLVPTYHKE